MSTDTNGHTAKARATSRPSPSCNTVARLARERRPAERHSVRPRPGRHHIPGFNPDATPC